MMRFTASIPLLNSLAVLCICCRADVQHPPTFVFRDSSGVEIVVSHSQQWDSASSWRINPEPAIAVGVVSGDERYQLFNVVDATRLIDGSIVVANRGTHQLKLYDSDGRYRTTGGGSGNGPGEFRSLAAVMPMDADSFVAIDWWGAAGRMSVYDTDSRFVRSLELRLPVFGLLPLHRFADGTYAGSERIGHPTSGYGVKRNRWFRLHRFGEDGEHLGSLTPPVEGVEYFSLPPASSTQGLSTFRAFGLNPQYAFGAGEFYLGMSDTYEIMCYDLNGRLRRILRRLYERRRITEADRDAYLEHEFQEKLDENFGWRRRQRQVFLRMDYPDEMPAYSSLQVDAGGNLWVEYYRPSWEQTSRWTVFDSSGVMLGDVEAPKPLEVYEIGQDYLLGRYVGEFQVEYVYVYSVEKP